MGRHEKPVDRTVPARAKLADLLRDRKAAAGLTHGEMSKRVNGVPSKATFERAASGTCVPSWETVETFIKVTATKEEEFAATLGAAVDRGRELWIRARRRTRAPYYVHKAPDPELISSMADFSRALRHQHIWAGYPTPGEMDRMSGPGELPSSTTRRIIDGDTLPVDPKQAIAFLKACYVRNLDGLESWLDAAIRALQQGGALSEKDLSRWVTAHLQLLAEMQAMSNEKEQERAA
ncbi:helix-turn-helix domain-containing protein [Streptomyces mirabilis]|uniref:helix-turn-helix domain-containing protein n=1 Tax=Streptomyces mirabilis TaxID=68239 RepID=UPI003828B0AC